LSIITYDLGELFFKVKGVNIIVSIDTRDPRASLVTIYNSNLLNIKIKCNTDKRILEKEGVENCQPPPYSQIGSSDWLEILTGDAHRGFIWNYRGVSQISYPAPSFGAKSSHVTTLLDEPKMAEFFFPIFQKKIFDSVSYAS
jgi:hypothetical protein